MAENKEVQEGKIFAILAYLSVLCVIPLLLKKDNKFALHHGKQGLVIFIGEIAMGILAWIPIIGWIVLGTVTTFNQSYTENSLLGDFKALWRKSCRHLCQQRIKKTRNS